jgi:hypothetical protein
LTTPAPLPGGAQYGTAILNGSGNGTAQIGPSRVREHWQVSGAAVKVSTQEAEASCSLYVGSTVDSSTFVGNTITGSSGDTCGLAGIDIQPGQYVFAVWDGGDPGSTATLTVFGTFTIGTPGS